MIHYLAPVRVELPCMGYITGWYALIDKKIAIVPDKKSLEWIERFVK